MKKFLAVIMALIMSFSVALIPAAAADEAETAADTVEEFFGAVETSVYLIEDTIAQIHNIVGQILAVLDKECPMCGIVHEVASEGGADEEIVDPEAPAEPEEPAEPEIPEEPVEPEVPAEPDAPVEEEGNSNADEAIDTVLYYVQTVLDMIIQVVDYFRTAE